MRVTNTQHWRKKTFSLRKVNVLDCVTSHNQFLAGVADGQRFLIIIIIPVIINDSYIFHWLSHYGMSQFVHLSLWVSIKLAEWPHKTNTCAHWLTQFMCCNVARCEATTVGGIPLNGWSVPWMRSEMRPRAAPKVWTLRCDMAGARGVMVCRCYHYACAHVR